MTTPLVTIPFAEFDPTLPKQDGVAVVFTIPAPDIPKLRIEKKDYLRYDTDLLPSKVFEEYAEDKLRRALVAAYVPHLTALRDQLGLDKQQYLVETDHYRLTKVGQEGHSWNTLLSISVDHTGSGYYRGPLGMVVRPERVDGLRQRKFDLTKKLVTVDKLQELAAGRETTVSVSANWSKIWTSVTTLLAAVVEARRVQDEARALAQRVEDEEKAASERVKAALGQVASKPGEYKHEAPVYSYGANFRAHRQPDGSYRFTLDLGGLRGTTRLPQSLANKLVTALPPSAQLHLTIDNLTDVDAAAILQMLPQKDVK